jgi:hypothetical protein
MKAKLIICILTTAAISFVSCNSSNQKSETKDEAKQDSTMMPAQEGDRVMYQCPMHPEEMSDKAAQCSKCGMDLEKITIRGNDTIRG